MAAVIGNRNISLGVMGGTLITAACYGGGEVFGCSPYDAATTRYLKATYPSYWAQICDYGYANPQLVPWINEDNDLIVSLVGVGKVRGLVGNGTPWIRTNVYVTQNTTFECLAAVKGRMSSSFQGVFGSRTSSQTNAFDICLMYDTMSVWYDFSNNANNSSTGDGHIALNKYTKLFLNQVGLYQDDTLIKRHELPVTASTSPNPIAIFGRIDGSYSSNPANARPLNGGVGYVKLGGDRQNMFVCFKLGTPRTAEQCYPQKACAAGTCGMLDLLTGTFYPNANTSGAFTIEITE